MTYTFDSNIVSDLYKDAFGFRPSTDWMQCWKAMPAAEKQEEWDKLCKISEEEAELDRQEEIRNQQEFEAVLATFVAAGAEDRATALRWMTQDEVFYSAQCVEHFVWSKGLLFTTYGRMLVKELEDIVSYAQGA